MTPTGKENNTSSCCGEETKPAKGGIVKAGNYECLKCGKFCSLVLASEGKVFCSECSLTTELHKKGNCNCICHDASGGEKREIEKITDEELQEEWEKKGGISRSVNMLANKINEIIDYLNGK